MIMVDRPAMSKFFILGFLIIAFVRCTPGDTKLEQYKVQGEQLYNTHCSNCHQKNGKGLGLVYPPVDKSDFVDQKFEEVICLMKHGREGEMMVNGKMFNQPMPGVPSLTELELAEIATYLYNSWGRQKGIVELTQVSEALKSCED